LRGYAPADRLEQKSERKGAAAMPSQVILEFEGVTTKEYDAVNKALGINMATGEGEWPDGLQVHAAGLNESGHLVVTEVWDTPDHQARFMEGRLAEALAKGGVTSPPSRITWVELVAHHTPGLST
jgi:hypothetical protein